MAAESRAEPLIDILCQVIDNFGDAGISWRLARLLAREWPCRVRLFIDRPDMLTPWRSRLAVEASARLAVHHFDEATHLSALPDLSIVMLATVLPEALRRRLVQAAVPRLRYEYLSAQAWIDGCHGLPSLNPTDGSVEWYWFPGYTESSAGLLREAGLADRSPRRLQAAAQHRERWLRQHDLASGPGVFRVCVFGYPEAATAALLQALAVRGERIDAFISRTLHASLDGSHLETGSAAGQFRLRVHDWLDQDGFDHLLASCDLALVRGEDSWVRAQWTGLPMLWQAYRQESDTHLEKLQAWLDRLLAGAEPDVAQALTGLMVAVNITAATGCDPAQAVQEARTRIEPALNAWLAQRAAIRRVHERWRDGLLSQASLIERLRTFARDQLQLPV